MNYDRSPEDTATQALNRAIVQACDPTLSYSPEQYAQIRNARDMLTVFLRASQGTVKGHGRHPGDTEPTFDDYRSARTYAGATGSVKVTYNGVEYVRAEDTHGPRECDQILNGGCSRCLDAYRRKYGYPQSSTPAGGESTSDGGNTP